MFSFLNRDRTAPPAPNPLTIRLRHIDIQLAHLAPLERTEAVWTAIDYWLDRRNSLRHGGEVSPR